MNSDSLEHSFTPEQPPRFEKVVFGHWVYEFDRDQFLTYYLALKAGQISLDTPVGFEPSVADSADTPDKNGAALVIEGTPAGSTINDGESGNYDNDPVTDDPATYMFYSKNQRDLARFKPALYVANYMRIFEGSNPKGLQRKEVKTSDLLSNSMRSDGWDQKLPTPKQFSLFTNKIFNGLLVKYSREIELDQSKGMQTLLREAVEILDLILSQKHETDSLVQKYQELIGLSQSNERQQENILKEHIKKPGVFKSLVTATGVRMVYFDTRGTGTRQKANGVASNYVQELYGEDAKTHILFLIADVLDAQGNVIGNKLQISNDSTRAQLPDTLIPENAANPENHVNLMKLLHKRIRRSEALFGKGYKAEYGGHHNLIGTHRTRGTGLQPEYLWNALHRTLDYPRYTAEGFARHVHDFFVNQLGIENVDVVSMTVPTEYDLSQYIANIGIPESLDNNREHIRMRTIELTEEDFPLYVEFFQSNYINNPSGFLKLLLDKTSLEEPAEIAQFRAEKAYSQITSELAQNSEAYRLLDIVNDLNAVQIRNLSMGTSLDLMEKISNDPVAIELIWDKENTRYGIVPNQIPVYMRDDVEQQKAGRYMFLSLPYKIDEYLIRGVYDKAMSAYRAGDKEPVQQLIGILNRVVNSDVYRNSHHDGGYDQLVLNMLRLAGDSVLHESAESRPIADQIISSLITHYGDSHEHWKSMVQSDRGLMMRLSDKFPMIRKFLERFGHSNDNQYDTRFQIELRRPSELKLPTENDLHEQINRQLEKGSSPPIVTFLTQIGRPIEDKVKRQGIIKQGNIHEDGIQFAGHFKVDGGFDMEPNSLEDQRFAELLFYVTWELIPQITKLHPDAKLRIVTGGYPGKVARKTVEIFDWLERAGKITSQQRMNIKKHIQWCDWNWQTGDYYDDVDMNVNHMTIPTMNL